MLMTAPQEYPHTLPYEQFHSKCGQSLPSLFFDDMTPVNSSIISFRIVYSFIYLPYNSVELLSIDHLYLPVFKETGLNMIEGVGLVRPKLFGFQLYFCSSFCYFDFFGSMPSILIFFSMNFGQPPNGSPWPLLANLKFP